MISRRTAKALAELYNYRFRNSEFVKNPYGGFYSYKVKTGEFYDYLYENDYEAWFCNLAKNLPVNHAKRTVLEFIMRLHTGETIANGLLIGLGTRDKL